VTLTIAAWQFWIWFGFQSFVVLLLLAK